MNHTPRYALYYSPEAGSAWERFGAQWFAFGGPVCTAKLRRSTG